MSEIPRIQVGHIYEIGVPNIYSYYVPHYYAPTVVAPGHPSVLQFIGRPIVDIPGCVKAHKEENRKTKLLPELSDDDPNEIMSTELRNKFPAKFMGWRMVVLKVPRGHIDVFFDNKK